MVGKGEKEMAKKEEVLPVVEKPADQVSLPSNTGKAVVEGETADKESVAEKPSTTGQEEPAVPGKGEVIAPVPESEKKKKTEGSPSADEELRKQEQKLVNEAHRYLHDNAKLEDQMGEFKWSSGLQSRIHTLATKR